ncbi:hypothetical protein ACUXA5_002373 [Corynebacterium hesseae]
MPSIRLFLESEDTTSAVVDQHQPVGVVLSALRWRHIAWAVSQTEKDPVELSQCPTVGSVDCRVE